MTSQNFQLVMQKGPNPGKVYELVQEEITIGRDISNRLVINDPEVSRRHARLTSQVGGYVIEDLGSTNGTFVDGQRLMGPHLLKPGQTVMFGEKITLAYEGLGFDPNATLLGAAGSQQAAEETYRVPPSDVYTGTPPGPTVRGDPGRRAHSLFSPEPHARIGVQDQEVVAAATRGHALSPLAARPERI